MMMILSKNSKTGYSTNLPIEDTCDKSCPFYRDKTCYGARGRFVFGVVKKANQARYAVYKTDPLTYFELLQSEILCSDARHIRINGVGDIPDVQYAEMLAALAYDMPKVEFWVSTRKMLCKDVEWPENVIVRYSVGVKGDYTTSVTDDPLFVTCPATIKNTVVKTCSQCGWKCWSKDVNNVTFLKH